MKKKLHTHLISPEESCELYGMDITLWPNWLLPCEDLVEEIAHQRQLEESAAHALNVKLGFVKS